MHSSLFPIDSVCLHCLYLHVCGWSHSKKLWNPAQLKTSKKTHSAWPRGSSILLILFFFLFQEREKNCGAFLSWYPITIDSLFLSLTYLFDWPGLWLQQSLPIAFHANEWLFTVRMSCFPIWMLFRSVHSLTYSCSRCLFLFKQEKTKQGIERIVEFITTGKTRRQMAVKR